jgi:hypothetical protein
MRVYQVVYDRRSNKHRIREIKVTGEEATCFRRPGPPALWPSKRTTFRRLRDAKRHLQDSLMLTSGQQATSRADDCCGDA